MTTAAQILDIAEAELGYKESPKNSNKTKYNRWFYGSNVAAPWCAIFVCWVFAQANAKKLLPGGRYDAYCPTIGDAVMASGREVSKTKGKAGDIVLFDWEQDYSSDHIGIIEKKNSDGSYTCIEGNTAIGNDSNGGEVMRRKRYTSQIYHVYRPAYSKATSASEGSSSDGQLVLDGKWGNATTTMTQRVMGTVEDGIVSGQLNSCKKYCINCYTSSWQFAAKGSGSPMVSAIQKLVGSTRDGKMGKNTIKAMQKFLKARSLYTGSIDGKMGWKTVDGWQRYINSKL